MKTTSQESVRSLFNLPKEEKVYDDFGCAYQDVILYHGRLFLTENFICFNSNIMGLKNKYIIPIRDVKDIKKRKTLGIFNNSIVVNAWDEKKKINNDYIFTSFASRNIAYKRIRMVWKSTMRIYNIVTESAMKSDTDSNSSKDDSVSNLGLNRSVSFSDANSIDQDLDGNNISKEDVYFPPIDPDKVFEGCKITIKEKSSQIFDKLIKDNAEFGFGMFYEQVMCNTNVSLTEWKEIEENVFVRDVNFMIKVKDVPFVSQTRVHKIQKLKKEGDKFTFWGSSSSLDVPYSSYFTIEDIWEFMPYEDNCVLRTSIYAAFTKSTMFKSKIEKKTKEEFKKEIDKWCEFILSKGIKYENYKPPNLRKLSKVEEESLKHGLEKNEIQQEYKKDEPKYKPLLIYLKELFKNNTKEVFMWVGLTIILILLLIVISKLNCLLNLENNNAKELTEIKTILKIAKLNNSNLSWINSDYSHIKNSSIQLDL